MMIDFSKDVDAFVARQNELEEILTGGKSKEQLAEIIALLKCAVTAPNAQAHKVAMDNLLKRLRHMDVQNRAALTKTV